MNRRKEKKRRARDKRKRRQRDQERQRLRGHHFVHKAGCGCEREMSLQVTEAGKQAGFTPEALHQSLAESGALDRLAVEDD